MRMGGMWLNTDAAGTRRRARLGVALASTLAGVSPLASATPLKVLPLGDSITWGWGSESTYGYRGFLDDLLTVNNVDHAFVGSITDEIVINKVRFIDPLVRELVGSTPHYSIPGASADRLGEQNRRSLLWSIRNDQDGDEVADADFANAGGLIPTLVDAGDAPDVVLLHIGTNDMGTGKVAATNNPGVYDDDAADSQLFRLLSGLGDDLANEGLITGSATDTRIVLSRIIPRPVDLRDKPKGAFGTDGIDDAPLANTIAYNDAIDAVVAALPTDLRNAITIVDMWDIDLTDPALQLGHFRDDEVVDQPFDTGTGNNTIFNEEDQQLNSAFVDEAVAEGPDYADWLLRYDEGGQDFYDAAQDQNDLRWNQGLFGLEVNGEFYDAIHPNINGYELMAHVFYAGLVEALAANGDFDGNGTVEQGDLDLVLQNWGDDTAIDALPMAWALGRIGVGVVDQDELDQILQNWGGVNVPDFRGVVVPEPVFAGVALGGLLARRVRRPAC